MPPPSASASEHSSASSSRARDIRDTGRRAVASGPAAQERRMQPPKTQYARNGEVNIAYQVVGNGPIDLAVVPGFISHLDLWWTIPETMAFIRRLAGFSRLILFDKRGTGLSDPVAG